MVGSIIGNIKNSVCGWDGKILGKGSSKQGHSHKELMKCLYKSNMELSKSMQISRKLEEEVKALQEQLAHYIIKEQKEKENTGLMDVKEVINVDDSKTEAKDLLEAESIIDESLGNNTA